MSVSISPFLKKALMLDAVVSGAAAALMLFGAGLLADLLALPEPLLRWAGAALVPFVALLLMVGTRDAAPRGLISAIAVANVLWVLASILVLVGGVASPNALGYVFVLAQAAAVALFAELQFIGLRRSSPLRA
jgi:hypothetical protein